ncbi:MAG: hypothetical protein ABJC62_01450 [Frankiaceae bacterium]
MAAFSIYRRQRGHRSPNRWPARTGHGRAELTGTGLSLA